MSRKDQEELFANPVKEHELLLSKVCRVYAYDMHERQDLLQEIVIQLWSAYPKFKGLSKVSTWRCIKSRFIQLLQGFANRKLSSATTIR